ncbi:arsenate reductase (azurin) small subunit [Verminephrobacter aporrectodeae subsp. tuberculatae]|uniref:arsenate reductase (azurin) small subunit n=1 Tax=Verminephrobacter aporrectodeae TaxID=1110389 RepID=UPI0022384CF5|nr:arsenate reductase (azurin) small subunit [Verminephrobacter aporrectodeae]MCW5219867.1 arsenate reductase (azurin) small subunit [Verminephrobacter aporrectodeae subsp. tuberculatae]MCW5289155.1 arsenate reductase (azurin) small subunit [Verminephrobacter aporrectodeae subsp. tuberculatae]
MNDVRIARRFFLKSGGVAVVAGSTVIPIHSVNATPVPADAMGTTLLYPRKAIGKVKGMPVNQAIPFSYPDTSSPCYAIRMGNAVPGGDIVAFSSMCTHMGCPVTYDGGTRTFKCGCHYSIFDPENSGQMVCGQATEDLPKIQLEYNSKIDSITAVGVDGLIYGRQFNIL